jgi:hypothetical protein
MTNLRLDQNNLQSVLDSWVGTPFRHHCAVKGAGADCIHFVVAALVEAGRLPESLLAEIPSYPRDWHLHSDDDRLAAGLLGRPGLFVAKNINLSIDGEAVADAQPVWLDDGDVALFQFGMCSSHAAVVCDEHFYHSVTGSGVIRTSGLDPYWTDRLRAGFTPIWRTA